MRRAAALWAAASCFAVTAMAAESGAPLLSSRPAWATTENDLGEVDPTLQLTHLTILLNRTPERQAAFDELLREQQDPQSPNFHHWLTPVQLGKQFGAPVQDVAALSTWLQSRGLRVDRVSNSRVRIEFSGSAASVSSAFRADLHAFMVDGDRRIAPAAPPRIPASLARSVATVLGLETVHMRPHYRLRGSQSAAGVPVQPEFSNCSGTSCSHYVTPADFASIYDVNSVYQRGINGAGQTIAILGRAKVYLPDIENFERLTGLAIKDPIITVPPNGIDPGPPQSTSSGANTFGDQGEATLDVTRATSVAPGATINLVISGNAATTSGLQIAAEYVVDSAVAPIMSISFGACESTAGSSSATFIENLFSQAAAEGVSVFVSSGDGGAAGCDKQSVAPPAAQFASPNVNCASGYATCVGGTEFSDTGNPNAYWSSNSSKLGSALGYIPEGAWNEPVNAAGNIQVAASGGGVSAFIATPTWQAGAGVPGMQGRYSPDVSFTASSHDGYFGCFAASGNPCVVGSNGGFRFSVFSGTSASAPSMAGIAALLNQQMGSGQGNLNPRLYALAKTPSNGVFHDITVATSGVFNCTPDTPSMCNNSMPSSTSLSGGLAGYTVGPGYDLVTGLGSVDVGNLLSQWAAALPGQLQLPASFTFPAQTVGTQSSTTVLNITNIGGTAVTVSSVTGTDLTDFPATTTCVTTLQPGAQCNVTVSFAPSTSGLLSQTITLTSNGIGSPQSFTVSGTGTTSSTTSNAPGPLSGLWWNPTESGWGIAFTQRRNIIFAAWYTYDLSGNPTWYVVPSCTLPSAGASGSCTGTVYQTGGPAFFGAAFDSSRVIARIVGSLTLSFQSSNVGTMSYAVSGVSRTLPITRQVFQSGTVPPSVDYTDLWWNPSESGWGMDITQQYGVMFLAWFVYDNSGTPVWYVAPDCVVAGAGCSGAAYATTGPPFGPSFDSARIHAFSVGNVSVTFGDANHGMLTYSINGVFGTKAITRQLF